MSAAMGMDPSLIVSGISAVLQAVQTWMAYRDSQRAADTFSDVMARGTSDPRLAHAATQLVTLAPSEVVSALGARVQFCWDRYLDILGAPPGSFLPPEIDDATEAVKACVCRELKRLKSVNGSLPPGQFTQWWNQYKCS